MQPDDFGYFVFYPYPGTHLFKECLEKGYLPANYQDLPANHRESILTFPSLTSADIAEYYERWTRVRTACILKRHGPDYSEANRQTVIDLVEACAASG